MKKLLQHFIHLILFLEKSTDKNKDKDIYMILDKINYSKGPLIRSVLIIMKNIFKIVFVIKKNYFQYSSLNNISKERKILKGLPYLLTLKNSKLACTSCLLCQTICPTSCIEITHQSKKSSAPPSQFTIEILKCIFCGFCEEVCPDDAIRLGPEKNLVGTPNQNWKWDKNYLAFRKSLNDGKGVLKNGPHPTIKPKKN